MRRGLGKGLTQILADSKTPSAKKSAPSSKAAVSVVNDSVLPITSIRANQRQPRTEFDDAGLADLAASIAEVGILQPLVVRPVGDDQYELIAGERRFRAAKLAGLHEVPVVHRVANAESSLQMALIENIQREDISAMECARAYHQLSNEFGLTQDQIAKMVGKSRTAITNTIRLLRLPIEIQSAILDGSVTEGQVRPLLAIPDAATQKRVWQKIRDNDLSARQVEALVKAMLGMNEKPTVAPKVAMDPHWNALETGLSTYFGTRTSLVKGKKGGRMIIDFYSDDELQRILDTLGVQL